jgi:hypothetical protein
VCFSVFTTGVLSLYTVYHTPVFFVKCHLCFYDYLFYQALEAVFTPLPTSYLPRMSVPRRRSQGIKASCYILFYLCFSVHYYLCIYSYTHINKITLLNFFRAIFFFWCFLECSFICSYTQFSRIFHIVLSVCVTLDMETNI